MFLGNVRALVAIPFSDTVFGGGLALNFAENRCFFKKSVTGQLSTPRNLGRTASDSIIECNTRKRCGTRTALGLVLPGMH